MKPTFLAASTLSLALALPALCSAASYNVTDLGTLPGGGGSNALGINSSGQIVGYSYTNGDAPYHAFLYSNGAMSDLGTLGGTQSAAQGINDSGQIVGYASTSSGAQHACLFYNGTKTDLGITNTNSFALGINSSGQIAGYNNGAFLYSNGTITELGTLPGGTYSYANGINDSGQIVGHSETADKAVHAFVYGNGTMTDLGTLPGGATSNANGINDSGQIAGGSDTVGNTSGHAFLYDGTMHDLGTLGGTFSDAHGINNSGQIVGYSYTNDNAYLDRHAFLYSSGTMSDLNQLLDSSGIGWTLTEATAINYNGWIVGNGTNPSGQLEAFLLTPTPEPSSVVLAALGLLGLASWRWRLAGRPGKRDKSNY